MPLLFFLVVTCLVGISIYILASKRLYRNKKNKKDKWKPLGISVGVMFVLLVIIAFGLYKSATAPDTQCRQIHNTNQVPSQSATANGYFKLGDFYYDQGNCTKAIIEYTKAIQLNSTFYQAYNNRAYTYMRMQDYKDALPDLNKAIQLKPNYIEALMNRADIHNYYYEINRQAAIVDYNKVIALTGPSGGNTSVCGHLFLAQHNGWNLGTILDFFNPSHLGRLARC